MNVKQDFICFWKKSPFGELLRSVKSVNLRLFTPDQIVLQVLKKSQVTEEIACAIVKVVCITYETSGGHARHLRAKMSS